MKASARDPEALVEVSGEVYGARLHGSLPASFAPYLRRIEGGSEPVRELETAYRSVDQLPAVEELWAAEPQEPWIRDRFALFRLPAGFGLRVWSESGGIFRIGADRIDVAWLAGGAGAPHFFYSYALPLWLELRGVTVLHASAVSFGDDAVAFLGASGVGKSTLCAELVGAGGRFVADDGLAVEEGRSGEWRCLPGPPWLRLWPSALERRLGVAAGELPRVHESLEKRRLAAEPGAEPAAGSRPRLAAVYLLERGPEEDVEVRVSPSGHGESLLRLIEHSLAGAPLAALGLSAARLDRLAGVAESVGVRRLRFAGGGDSVEKVRQAILRDLAAA